MKNILLLLIILSVIITCYVNATETRISALGSEQNILIDDTNIYHFPTSLERFVERVIVEYGFHPYSNSLSYFSLLKEVGKFGNLGLVLNKTGIPVYPSTNGGTLITQPTALINLYYSLRIKDALNLGISGGYGVGASNADAEGTANDTTDESSISSGRISLCYYLGEKENFLEISAGARNHTFTYKIGDNFTFTNNNKMSMDYSGRFFLYLNDYVSLIPFFDYSTLDLSSKQSPSPISQVDITRITTTSRAGIGLNMFPFEENRIVIGVIYNTTVYEKSCTAYDTTVTDNSIPEIVAGIESELKSWLTVRAGIKKSLLISETESANGVKSIMTDKKSPFQLHAGLGIRLGSLRIDAILNENFAFTNAYFISGEENIPLTEVSATYHF